MTYRGGEHTQSGGFQQLRHYTGDERRDTQPGRWVSHGHTVSISGSGTPSLPPQPTLTPALSRQADLEDGADAERARDWHCKPLNRLWSTGKRGWSRLPRSSGTSRESCDASGCGRRRNVTAGMNEINDKATRAGSREPWGLVYSQRRSAGLQSCRTPRSRAWTRMWCFPWWPSPHLGSSTARRSVKQWSGSWVPGPRPFTAPSGRSGPAAFCLPRRSARWAAGRRTTTSTSCTQKERRREMRPARGRRTRVPPTSPTRRTRRPRTWTWAGLRSYPGCRQGVCRCTPVLLQTESRLSGRSSGGTCKKPDM